MLFLTSLSHSALLFNPKLLRAIALLFFSVEMLFPILRATNTWVIWSTPIYLMTLTLWNKRQLSMLELTLSSANFQLPHWAPNCCCSEHIVLRYMAVIFGAPCFSTHIVCSTLRIMMLSNNCYNNLDGVVHLNSLCLIMCLHFLVIYVLLAPKVWQCSRTNCIELWYVYCFATISSMA